MIKIEIGISRPSAFGGSVLWLDAGQAFPLYFWKTGVIKATIAQEDEPIPEDRYYVRVYSLGGPVKVIDSETGEATYTIGKNGDQVDVYRAGQKEARFIVWPGRYARIQADAIAALLGEDDPGDDV